MSKSCSIKVVRLAVVAVAVWAMGGAVWAASEDCTYQGSQAFCQWGTGCYAISAGNEDWHDFTTCPPALDKCENGGGGLFTGVSTTNMTEANGFGNDLSCAAEGGTLRAGKDVWTTDPQLGYCKWSTETACYPVKDAKDAADCQTGTNVWWAGESITGTPECPTSTPDYDGSAKASLGCCLWEENAADRKCWDIYDEVEDGQSGADRVGYCSSGGNTFWSGACPSAGTGACPTTTPTYEPPTGPIMYCRFEGDSNKCYRIPTQDHATPEECEAGYGEAVSDCNAAAGAGVWCDYGPETEDGGGCHWTNEGASKCEADYGTVVSSCGGSSVRVSSLQVSKVAGLRATYARGSIGVTYSAASPIVSGKVQLVNTKGRVVASAPISKSSGSTTVTAQLSFKKVPAGMYFVRVNAKDVKGKRVAEQTSISIVK